MLNGTSEFLKFPLLTQPQATLATLSPPPDLILSPTGTSSSLMLSLTWLIGASTLHLNTGESFQPKSRL